MQSPLEQTITPVTHDLGGFSVNRVLPARERTMVGPFIFVDGFGPARLPAGQGMDVRPHPHINLATVTYLFEGAIEHRDSIGSRAVIEPGAINLMTAGSGIVHSERSPEAVRASGGPMYGMQTWLALPDGREEVEPAFDHVPADQLPLVENGAARARVLMGTLWGETAGTRCDSPTIYADIELGVGGTIPVDREADERAVMLVGGEAVLDDVPLAPYALYVLKPGHVARLSSASGGRVMLMGGAAFTTTRHVFWNFVSSSRDRLNQAKEDWKAMRFPLIPGDDQEFIPLPKSRRRSATPKRVTLGRLTRYPLAMPTAARSRSRSAARLAAVQALYQQEMEGTPLPRLLKEFHDHRLGATIEDAQYHKAERDFFDDIVTGADARRGDIDAKIAANLAQGWTIERLDRPMRAILRAGAYELLARPDVPVGSVISEYVDVAHAFYDKRESGFVNGLLDAIAKQARPARAG